MVLSSPPLKASCKTRGVWASRLAAMGAHSHTPSSDRGQGESGRWLHGVDRAVQTRGPQNPWAPLHDVSFMLLFRVMRYVAKDT